MSVHPSSLETREDRANRAIRFLTIAGAALGTTLTLWGFALAIHV